MFYSCDKEKQANKDNYKDKKDWDNKEEKEEYDNGNDYMGANINNINMLAMKQPIDSIIEGALQIFNTKNVIWQRWINYMSKLDMFDV